jgi:hypothetical protein
MNVEGRQSKEKKKKRKDERAGSGYQILGATDALFSWSIELSQNEKRSTLTLMKRRKVTQTSTNARKKGAVLRQISAVVQADEKGICVKIRSVCFIRFFKSRISPRAKERRPWKQKTQIRRRR